MFVPSAGTARARSIHGASAAPVTVSSRAFADANPAVDAVVDAPPIPSAALIASSMACWTLLRWVTANTVAVARPIAANATTPNAVKRMRRRTRRLLVR